MDSVAVPWRQKVDPLLSVDVRLLHYISLEGATPGKQACLHTGGLAEQLVIITSQIQLDILYRSRNPPHFTVDTTRPTRSRLLQIAHVIPDGQGLEDLAPVERSWLGKHQVLGYVYGYDLRCGRAPPPPVISPEEGDKGLHQRMR